MNFTIVDKGGRGNIAAKGWPLASVLAIAWLRRHGVPMSHLIGIEESV
jgi:hypothetical protein